MSRSGVPTLQGREDATGGAWIETATVDRAKAVLAAVRSDSFPWPGEGRALISGYAEYLRDDLEARDDLLSGRRHPASEFPGLASGWPHDALGQAVDRVTQDIGEGTGALAEVIRQFFGDATADSVLAAAAEAGQREGER